MSVQRIVEDTPPIEMQAETQYDDTEAPVSGVFLYMNNRCHLMVLL